MKLLFAVASLAVAQGAFGEVLVDGQNPSSKDLDGAAQLAVKAVKEVGANGLIEVINECYQMRIDNSQQDFKCVWIDIAGQHIDQSFSKVAGIKPKIFWSHDQMEARAAPAFKAAGIDSYHIEEYYKSVKPKIFASVAKYMNNSSDESAEDPIPLYDVKSYCNIIANYGGSPSEFIRKGCYTQEQSAYNEIKSEWPNVPKSIRSQCDSIAKTSGPGSYALFNGCIKQEISSKEENQNFELKR